MYGTGFCCFVASPSLSLRSGPPTPPGAGAIETTLNHVMTPLPSLSLLGPTRRPLSPLSNLCTFRFYRCLGSPRTLCRLFCFFRGPLALRVGFIPSVYRTRCSFSLNHEALETDASLVEFECVHNLVACLRLRCYVSESLLTARVSATGSMKLSAADANTCEEALESRSLHQLCFNEPGLEGCVLKRQTRMHAYRYVNTHKTQANRCEQQTGAEVGHSMESVAAH